MKRANCSDGAAPLPSFYLRVGLEKGETHTILRMMKCRRGNTEENVPFSTITITNLSRELVIT